MNLKEKINNQTYWVPFSANDPNAKRCNYTSFEKSKVHHSKTTMADVKAALLYSEESLDNSKLMIKEHEEFTRYEGKGNWEVMLRHEISCSIKGAGNDQCYLQEAAIISMILFAKLLQEATVVSISIMLFARLMMEDLQRADVVVESLVCWCSVCSANSICTWLFSTWALLLELIENQNLRATIIDSCFHDSPSCCSSIWSRMIHRIKHFSHAIIKCRPIIYIESVIRIDSLPSSKQCNHISFLLASQYMRPYTWPKTSLRRQCYAWYTRTGSFDKINERGGRLIAYTTCQKAVYQVLPSRLPKSWSRDVRRAMYLNNFDNCARWLECILILCRFRYRRGIVI